MADARDIVLVIGDVGVETIYRERMLWTGAGGARSISPIRCATPTTYGRFWSRRRTPCWAGRSRMPWSGSTN